MERLSARTGGQTYPGTGWCSPAAAWITAPLCRPESVRPQVRIETLSDPQVKSFLPSTARNMARRCGRSSRTRRNWSCCARRTISHCWWRRATTGDIPAGRAALFTGFVRRALQREVQGWTGCFSRGPGPCRTMWRASPRTPGAPRMRCLRVVPCCRSSAPWPGRCTPRRGDRGLPGPRCLQRGLAMLDHPDAEDILKAGGALACWTKTVAVTKCCMCTSYSRSILRRAYLARQPQPALVHQEWRADGWCPVSADAAAAWPMLTPCRLCPARAGRKRQCWPPPWPASRRVLSRTSWRTTWRWRAAVRRSPR